MLGRSIFKILISYFSGVLGCIFNIGSRTSFAYLKLKSTSFNLSQKDRFSFRAILSGILYIVKVPLQKIEQNNSTNAIIYDIANDTEKERVEFLEYYGVKEQFSFLSPRDLLKFNSVFDKFLFLFFTIPVQIHICIYGIFKKDRSGLHSVLKNLLITRNFFKLNKHLSGRKIYLFSIYDTNSAFLSNNLIKSGARISQVTSEVPLYKWNKIIVTNELILCSDYQLLEIEKFKDSMFFDSFKLFGPELYYKIAKKYELPQGRNSNVGFYSTGGWVRNKLGHIDQGIDMEMFETRILNDLDKILSKRKEIKLIIYPHPREKAFFKNSEIDLYNYYHKFLPTANFEISNNAQPSNLLFDDVYIAICYMTTLIFERMHAKRKSVIAYFKEKDFPLKNKFDYLEIVTSESELQKVIDLNY
jgi:hypothetical protein